MGRPPQVTEASQATDVRVSFLLAMDGKADKDDFRPNKVVVLVDRDTVLF